MRLIIRQTKIQLNELSGPDYPIRLADASWVDLAIGTDEVATLPAEAGREFADLSLVLSLAVLSWEPLV